MVNIVYLKSQMFKVGILEEGYEELVNVNGDKIFTIDNSKILWKELYDKKHLSKVLDSESLNKSVHYFDWYDGLQIEKREFDNNEIAELFFNIW